MSFASAPIAAVAPLQFPLVIQNNGKEAAASAVASHFFKYPELIDRKKLKSWIVLNVAPHVEDLDLCGARLTEKGVKLIAKHCTSLKNLYVSGCTIDGAAVDDAKIAAYFPKKPDIHSTVQPNIPRFKEYSNHIKRAFSNGYGKGALPETIWGNKLPELFAMLNEINKVYVETPTATASLTTALRGLTITSPYRAPHVDGILSILTDYIIVPGNWDSRTALSHALTACDDHSLFGGNARRFSYIFQETVAKREPALENEIERAFCRTVQNKPSQQAIPVAASAVDVKSASQENCAPAAPAPSFVTLPYTSPATDRILSITAAFLVVPHEPASCELVSRFLEECTARSLFGSSAVHFSHILDKTRAGVAPEWTRGTLEHGFYTTIQKGYVLKPPAPSATPPGVSLVLSNEAPAAAAADTAATGTAAAKAVPQHTTAEQNLLIVDLRQNKPPQKGIAKWLLKYAEKHPIAKRLMLHQECHVTQELVSGLKHFMKLAELHVTSREFDDTAALLLAHTGLEDFTINCLDKCTKKGFQALAKASTLKNLEVQITGDTQEKYILELAASTTLKRLKVCGITDAGAQALRARMSKQCYVDCQTITALNLIADALMLAREEAAARAFFVGPTILDVRSIHISKAHNFHRKLPQLLGEHPSEVVRVRLPMCSLDAPLIEVLEKHAIREVNLGLCRTRDMQRLSLHAGLTALINSPTQESLFTAWIPPEEGRRKLQFLSEKLLPRMLIPANSFDAEDIEHISAMKGLTYLDLYNCPALSDALAPQLGKLTNLTTLYAMGAPLTAAGMKTLAPLAQLRCLSVMNCNKLNDDGMDALTAQFKGLEELILGNNGLSSDRLFDLLFRLTKLRTLIVGHQPKTTIAGLKKLAGLRSLERLSVVGDNYSEELLLHLLEKLPNLQVLSFHSMAKETLSPRVLAKAAALNKKIYLFQVPSSQSRADAAATAAALLGGAKAMGRTDLKQGHFG